MRYMILLAVLLVLAGAAQPAPLDEAGPLDPLVLQAAVGAAGAAGALLGEEAALSSLLPLEGCLIWQQPGVALVPQTLWEPGRAVPELYLDLNVLYRLLGQLPGYSLAEPEVYPREADYSADSVPLPQVYLLGREAAQRRLGQYAAGYQQWVEYNSVDGAWPEGFRHLTSDDLAVDCAAVYVADWQALSFFFRLDEQGRPRLVHFVIHPFFSA